MSANKRGGDGNQQSANGSANVRSSRSPARPQGRISAGRRLRGKVLISLAALFAIELTAATLTSSRFNVRHERITGITPVALLSPSEELMTRSAASLPAGTNWFLAPVSQVTTRLNSLAWVKSASVARRLPLKVETELKLRAPAYALLTPAGSFEVGDDNVPIRPMRADMQDRLVTVAITAGGTPVPGRQVDRDTVRTAGEILRRTRSDSSPRIAKIEIDQSTNIWLNMDTGVRVKFGNCEAIDKKIAVIRRLLSNGRGAQFIEINVSTPDWPAGRVREPAKTGADAALASAVH